jgi:hypothetical protein
MYEKQCVYIETNYGDDKDVHATLGLRKGIT